MQEEFPRVLGHLPLNYNEEAAVRVRWRNADIKENSVLVTQLV